MKVGFIGLGKLGLPVALAVEAAGHMVLGWDTNEDIRKLILDRGELPYLEAGAQELLDENHIQVWEPHLIAESADLVFIAVQTPHQPEFEGITRLPEEREDFDYGHLCLAFNDLEEAKCPVVVISTVLPGTLGRILESRICTPRDVLYNPFFIAMGPTIPDFRKPEFVLVGTDGAHPGVLESFYQSIHDRPIFVTTIKTAELTKMAYNTFIGLKIAFGNTMMELCEKTGADVDDLVDALSLATDRVISPAYLRGGMGDGGGCHPRDNIALSWLAREVGLSYDLFSALMECRERQTEWLVDLIQDEQNSTAEFRPIEIMGKAYKPETNLIVGSPALLLASMLSERGISFTHTDPYVEEEEDGRTR
jgi:UDPglucose 6-dehydrogenase